MSSFASRNHDDDLTSPALLGFRLGAITIIVRHDKHGHGQM